MEPADSLQNPDENESEQSQKEGSAKHKICFELARDDIEKGAWIRMR